MPYKTAISPTLKNLQNTVGGHIETFTFARNATIICNEEGRLLGLPYNCSILDVDFVGPIVFAGVDGDEFTDFPLGFPAFKELFRHLWEDN